MDASLGLSQTIGRIKRTLSFEENCNQQQDGDNKDAQDPQAPQVHDEAKEQANQNFGGVLHYGVSISPSPQVKWICLSSCALFSANSTAVLACAFRYMNATTNPVTATSLMFVGLLIGGVYLPMPASLWITRTVTSRFNHRYGLVVFGSFMLLGHVCIVMSQLLNLGGWVLLVARLIQGLGSGMLFQVRFVMAQLSTSDQHSDLQSWIFLVSDLGLGLGALLPAATSALFTGPGQAELLPTAIVLALLSILYLTLALLVFPKRLPFLPDSVRFASKSDTDRNTSTLRQKEGDAYRFTVLLSGTARVFVQSAILPIVALSMRDARWTGNFRQTFAVAAICLLPMPFEAFVARICCSCSMRSRITGDSKDSSKMFSGAIGAIALLIASVKPRNTTGEDGDVTTLLYRICGLAALMIALAMAQPANASRLYQLQDAERALVMLEWMKAYVGRLFGPLFAVLAYHCVGYVPVLAILCLATAIVTLTA